MYVTTGQGRRRKRVEMTFKREWLAYDIANYAFVEGDVMKADDEHERHQVQDICEDGNKDRVNRVLDLAYAECTEMLFPLTKEPFGGEYETGIRAENTCVFPQRDKREMARGLRDGYRETGCCSDGCHDNSPEDADEDYIIMLLVPDDFSITTVRLLVKCIHEYMVCRVLADWLEITLPSASKKWQEKAEDMKGQIKRAVNFRVGKVRIRQTPF